MGKPYDIAVAAGRSFYRLWFPSAPLHDIERCFPGAEGLQRHWREIRQEALQLPGGLDRIPRVHEFFESQTELSDSDPLAWRYFVLRAFGRDQAANQALCPVTSRLVRAMPEAIAAGFAVMDGGKRLAPHRGPYAGMLRYHLGLVVPPAAAGAGPSGLRIADAVRVWREGEGFLFDDSFEHEAWNNADSPRIVLIVDIRHPDMPAALRVIDRAIFFVVTRLPFVARFLAQGEISPDRPAAAPAGDDGRARPAEP